MKYLHHSSSVIQAAYRGHLARRRFARIVSEQVNCMKRRHYDVMATKIQTRWRGYYTRKYKHNYYARKAYLRAVQQRNYDVRHALDQYAESQRDHAEMAARKQLEEEKMLQARRFHYLRSTYQINGVFASPWQPQQEFEKRLTSVKPLTKEERDRLFPRAKAPEYPSENTRRFATSSKCANQTRTTTGPVPRAKSRVGATLSTIVADVKNGNCV